MQGLLVGLFGGADCFTALKNNIKTGEKQSCAKDASRGVFDD
jgi:hypothetical protein